jgi:hypothetical protein
MSSLLAVEFGKKKSKKKTSGNISKSHGPEVNESQAQKDEEKPTTTRAGPLAC